MNIWIGNPQSQGQPNWFACDITTRNKIPWNHYNYITTCLFFVLKSKQLRICFHSYDEVVYPFHKICGESFFSGMAKLPGYILVFHHLRLSTEHQVQTSINAPGWGQSLTHYLPKRDYSYPKGRSGSSTAVEWSWPWLSTGWDLHCFYHGVLKPH